MAAPLSGGMSLVQTIATGCPGEVMDNVFRQESVEFVICSTNLVHNLPKQNVLSYSSGLPNSGQ